MDKSSSRNQIQDGQHIRISRSRITSEIKRNFLLCISIIFQKD
jgi:hypothetical protein